jgi:plasmid stabilization system protein ParE
MAQRSYAIRITQSARNDIDNYYARLRAMEGVPVADEWRTGLLEAIGTLATLPERCSVAPEGALFSSGPVRQLLYRRRRSAIAHRVFFTVHDRPDDAPFVRIQHVRHGAQGPMTVEEAQTMEQNPDQ